MEWLADPAIWIAFLTLTLLELVLGIDNVIFISILSGKLPPEQQPKARFIGLALALLMRVVLLFSLTWVMGLTAPLFSVFSHPISGRDLILLIGGLFLIGKSHARNSRLARRRRRSRVEKSLRFVCRRDCADHAARHRVLARFGDHGGRHGR